MLHKIVHSFQWFVSSLWLSIRLWIFDAVQKIGQLPYRSKGNGTPEQYFYDQADTKILESLFCQPNEEVEIASSKVVEAFENWKCQFNSENE